MAMKSAMRRLLKRLPAADVGTLARAQQHIREYDGLDDGSFAARLDAPTRGPALPEDTADLEARAFQAINEAGSAEDLAGAWSGIKAEFEEADASIPLAIEARYNERRETIQHD